MSAESMLHEIFEKYWMTDDEGKWKFQVIQLTKDAYISKAFKNAGLLKIVGTHQSGARLVCWSRSQYQELCRHVELLKKHSIHNPSAFEKNIHPEDKNIYNSYLENLARVAKEKQQEERKNQDTFLLSAQTKCSQSDFTKQELLVLSIFKHHLQELFQQNKLSFNQLAFKLKISPRRAQELYASCLRKGGLIVRVDLESGANLLEGINQALEIPEIQESSRIKQVVPSQPAQKLFHYLSENYIYVFPELTPASFMDFDSVKDALDETGRKRFFMLRYDFVCCDEDFQPNFILEYNGSHHWTSEGNDSDKRKLKRFLADYFGIPMREINSIKQLQDFIGDEQHEPTYQD